MECGCYHTKEEHSAKPRYQFIRNQEAVTVTIKIPDPDIKQYNYVIIATFVPKDLRMFIAPLNIIEKRIKGRIQRFKTIKDIIKAEIIEIQKIILEMNFTKYSA